MSGVRLKVRPMIQGKASGVAVVSRKAFTFAHGVDPSTGKVTDAHSDVEGEDLRGRILFYPFGKGSTTASAWFLETVRLGNGPAAVVTGSTDLSIVIGSVLARSVYAKVIPVLSSFPNEAYGSVKTGDHVEVDGTTGEIVISGQ